MRKSHNWLLSTQIISLQVSKLCLTTGVGCPGASVPVDGLLPTASACAVLHRQALI